MKRTKLTVIGAALCALASAGAMAATAAQLVAARQASYKQIGGANKAIQDELHGASPNLATIRTNAQTLENLSKQVNSWFPKGTGPESGVKTAALPAIWEKPDDFRAQAQAFYVAAHGLNLAAASGNVDAIKQSAQAVGGTCRSCHQSYRARD